MKRMKIEFINDRVCSKRFFRINNTRLMANVSETIGSEKWYYRCVSRTRSGKVTHYWSTDDGASSLRSESKTIRGERLGKIGKSKYRTRKTRRVGAFEKFERFQKVENRGRCHFIGIWFFLKCSYPKHLYVLYE